MNTYKKSRFQMARYVFALVTRSERDKDRIIGRVVEYNFGSKDSKETLLKMVSLEVVE